MCKLQTHTHSFLHTTHTHTHLECYDWRHPFVSLTCLYLWGNAKSCFICILALFRHRVANMTHRVIVLFCFLKNTHIHSMDSTNAHGKAILHFVDNHHYSTIHVLATFFVSFFWHQGQRKPAYSLKKHVFRRWHHTQMVLSQKWWGSCFGLEWTRFTDAYRIQPRPLSSLLKIEVNGQKGYTETYC